MIVRGARRFASVPRSLPRPTRRAFTEETPRIEPIEPVEYASPVTPQPQETPHLAQVREQLEIRKKAIESLKLAIEKPLLDEQNPGSEDQGPSAQAQEPVSEVQWALAHGYEIGGHLEHGKGPLDRYDEKGLVKWGEWGLWLKIRGWSGSDIIKL